MLDLSLPPDVSSYDPDLSQLLGDPLTWRTLDLNRTAHRLDHSYMQLMGIKRPHVGFAWQQGDRVTPKWYPQGITGVRSSSSVNASQKFVVVSWYGRVEERYDHKGVRLSFCDVTDMDAIRYRHVLLVQPVDGERVFQPIEFHAGGIATNGHHLFVASPGGMRVFDANRIFKVSPDGTKSKCGMHGGEGFAFDYLYVLPQVARYHMSHGDGVRFSYCSTDLTNPSAPRLLTGNYHDHDNTTYRNPPALISWWDLDGGSILSGHARVETNIEHVQGALALGDRVWMSGGASKPRLRVGKVANGAFTLVHDDFTWPRGCEDLHYSTISDNLWCLSEYPYSYATDPKHNRFVWAVKLSDYTP